MVEVVEENQYDKSSKEFSHRSHINNCLVKVKGPQLFARALAFAATRSDACGPSCLLPVVPAEAPDFYWSAVK